MKKDDKNFEEFFRNAFEGAEMTPSPQAWQNISDSLNKGRNYRVFWWAGSVAASLVVMFLAYILVYDPCGKPTENANLSAAKAIENKTTIAEKQQSTAAQILPETKAGTAKIATENSVAEKASNSNIVNAKTENVAPKNIANIGTENIGTTKQKIAPEFASKTQNGKNKIVVINNSTENQNQDKIQDKSKSKTQDKTQPLVAKTTAVSLLAEKEIVVENQLEKVLFINSLEPKGLNWLTKIEIPLLVMPVVQTQQLQVNNLATPTKTSWEVGVLATYNSFQPNFSDVKDGLVPNAFITHNRGTSLNYDKNTTIGQDLATNMTNINSLSLGLQVSKNLIGNFGLRSGLFYTSSNYEVQTTTTYFISTASGLQTSPNTLFSKTQLFSVPLVAFYQMQTGKLVYGLQAGVQTDFLLQNTLNNSLESQFGHTYSFGEYKKVNFNGLVGLRIGYLVLPKLLFSAEANYRKALHSVYDTPNLQAHPQWLSVGFGLGYKF
jgi:hypothetical protein